MSRTVSNFAYHTQEYAKEVARTAERNAWLAQFWATLPPEEKAE